METLAGRTYSQYHSYPVTTIFIVIIGTFIKHCSLQIESFFSDFFAVAGSTINLAPYGFFEIAFGLFLFYKYLKMKKPKIVVTPVRPFNPEEIAPVKPVRRVRFMV